MTRLALFVYGQRYPPRRYPELQAWLDHFPLGDRHERECLQRNNACSRNTCVRSKPVDTSRDFQNLISRMPNRRSSRSTSTMFRFGAFLMCRPDTAAGEMSAPSATYFSNHAIHRLCSTWYQWTALRTSKAAVRLQTLLDLHGSIPSFILITDDKTHYVDVLDELVIKLGLLHLLDRGQLDSGRLFCNLPGERLLCGPSQEQYQILAVLLQIGATGPDFDGLRSDRRTDAVRGEQGLSRGFWLTGRSSALRRPCDLRIPAIVVSGWCTAKRRIKSLVSSSVGRWQLVADDRD